MILSFKCKQTQALFEGGHPRQFRAFEAVATRKLTQLDSAMTLDFMRSPPGNRFKALRGNRADQYSVRINDQWGLCFRWVDGHAEDVEITDYH